MSDKRNTRRSKADRKAQGAEDDRTGKNILAENGIDLNNASTILLAGQQIVVDDEDKEYSGQVERSATSLKRKAPDFSNPLKEMVEVTIGRFPDQDFTIIHKAVLCSVSPYFDVALNENKVFVNNRVTKISVDFTTPTIFGLFQQWIYDKKISNAENKLPPTYQMVQLWILADKLQVPVLQNLTIKVLCGKIFCRAPEEFNFLYQNTAPNSPLRKLFVRGVIVQGTSLLQLSKLLEDHWDQIPPAMMKEIILAQRRALELIGPRPLPKFEDYLMPKQPR